MSTSRHHRGFIALISAIIIAVILLVVVTTIGMSSLLSRFNVLGYELKQRSSALAEACADKVLLSVAQDAGYPVGYTLPQTVSVGGDVCTILSSSNPSGNPRTFTMQAVYQHSYTNLQLTVDVNTLVITSWQEVPTF